MRSFNLVTDHSFKSREQGYADTVTELFGVDNIRTTKIHAKFVLIHNEDYKVCIRTSMNLNGNRRIENFEIDENEEIFNFYLKFVEHLFDEMPKGFVINNGVVTKCVDKYFIENQKQISGWSEI